MSWSICVCFMWLMTKYSLTLSEARNNACYYILEYISILLILLNHPFILNSKDKKDSILSEYFLQHISILLTLLDYLFKDNKNSSLLKIYLLEYINILLILSNYLIVMYNNIIDDNILYNKIIRDLCNLLLPFRGW